MKAIWLIFLHGILWDFGQAGIRNIVVLLADDAGFEMGAYLNKYCQTPNLDQLASKGLIFNNAFTSVSSCSPSRAQILTGKSSHASGMYGLHQGVHNFNVFPKIQSLPNILASQGAQRPLTGIIGKKHVGGTGNFKFDFEETEEQHSINQIGRNITNIKLYTRKFLTKAKEENKGFFLMVGFHDPHRCGHITPQYGEFCERWGSGEKDMGVIPDWTPIYYDWRNLKVPQYLPDTDEVKKELAAQYMTISRLDQGVGLVLQELKAFGVEEETLVVYTSDNGPPFPGGRTNLYEAGIRVPFLVYLPDSKARHHETTAVMTTLADLFPTVLDFYDRKNFNYSDSYTKSLLPILYKEPQPSEDDAVFGSQNFHEITMNYPMRMIRTRRYKLIHNLNYWGLFPIDQDLYTSGTFQEILNSSLSHEPLPWMRTLQTYYQRPEWQLFDIKLDPLETTNLAQKPKYEDVLNKLKNRLLKWQKDTNDPWQCAPHAVLQSEGVYKANPICMTLGHDVVKSKPLSQYEKYYFA